MLQNCILRGHLIRAILLHVMYLWLRHFCHVLLSTQARSDLFLSRESYNLRFCKVIKCALAELPLWFHNWGFWCRSPRFFEPPKFIDSWNLFCIYTGIRSFRWRAKRSWATRDKAIINDHIQARCSQKVVAKFLKLGFSGQLCILSHYKEHHNTVWMHETSLITWIVKPLVELEGLSAEYQLCECTFVDENSQTSDILRSNNLSPIR